MNTTDIITTAATAHQIESDELAAFLTTGGWDFSCFTGQADEIAFIGKMADHYAGQLAARRDRLEANRAKAAQLRDARLTKAARANPDRQCGKCDGTGRINAFSHIAGGSCFQCQGTGVVRVRRCA